MGNTFLLSRSGYVYLFLLAGFAAVTGLFIPLMDNDAAHHANIALRMYLTGDYVNLIDNGKDYLDKPHLHFWLASFSYRIFGVNAFAYKLPSFLFSIIGVYAVFSLAKLKFNTETGRLAALLFASAAAFQLSLSDVRMEAILTAGIAIASWQGYALLLNKKWMHIAGTALGLAIGFSTKGQIGVLLPGLFILLCALTEKKLRFLFTWRWLLVILLFILFISPVLYCYYLQFNLHPEKTIRGMSEINGITFILFNQGIERAAGGMGDVLQNDYFFFLHSFLWTFAPWSIAAIVAIFFSIKNKTILQNSAGLLFTFLFFGLLLTFSRFKLPHYLPVCFPFIAVFTARWLQDNMENEKRIRILWRIHTVIAVIVILFTLIINTWFFQVSTILPVIITVLLLSLLIHYSRSQLLPVYEKMILVPFLAMMLFIFLVNTNFFPALLKYQAGTEMALRFKKEIDPEKVWFWKGDISASWQFNTATLRKEFRPRIMALPGKKWLAYYAESEPQIIKSGLTPGKKYVLEDYEITRLTLPFLNPSTRKQTLSALIIAEIPELPQ